LQARERKLFGGAQQDGECFHSGISQSGFVTLM
jgi:hypothetical protein